MALISRQLPALFNGVSQQPATLRLPSQCEEQINAYGTVADGLRKRPPLEHIAKVGATPFNGAFIHTINRDTAERYIVVVFEGDLKVFDTNGSEKVVSFPLGKSYLVTGNTDVSQSFALVSIADYTFVVNKTIKVETKDAPTGVPANLNEWVSPRRDGVLGRLEASLINQLRYYNPAYGTYRGVVQTFNDLPKPGDNPAPMEGDLWKVAGYDEDSFGAYYVVRRGGVWEETHAPGNSTAFDETTMPHALVRESDGTFSFRPFAWDVRRYGDEVSNPVPSFAGRTIQDVFYYKNRLGFVTDENVVFSCAGDFGNFWRNTVTDLLDSDVVDVAVSSTKVSLLKYAVPFNNNMMLFADQTQFALNVDQLLTPSSVSIDTVTDYEMSTKVRPVPIGNDVYFVTESGNYSRVREYFVDDGDTNSTDAADITAHVPRYLPKNVIKMTGNANEDVLFALSADTPNRLYVYKFFWNEGGKAQSAWSYWELPSTDKILSIEVLDNELYLLIERSEGVFLEKADLQSGATTGDLNRQVLLDRLTAVVGTYYSSGDYTEWRLPYQVDPVNQPGFRLVRGSGFAGQVLSLVDPSQYQWISPTTIRAPGNHADKVVWAGQGYTMRYTFSEQFMMNGDKAVTTGRLMLRTFVVYYTDTAFFKTEVAPYGTDPLVESVVPAQLSEFTGKSLGESSLKIGEPVFHTGRYAFQVYGDSKVAKVSLINDAHVQSVFQSAEFEAFYYNRARSL